MRFLNFFFIILAALVPSGTSCAQVGVVDSLQQRLLILKDSARIDCINNISYAYIQNEYKDSAIYFANLALNEGRNKGYFAGVAIALTRKARIAKHFDDDFVQTETLARQSLEWYDKTENKDGIYDTYSELAYALRSQSRFLEAIDYTQKMYSWGKTHHDKLRTIEALESLPSIYKDAGDYEMSFEYSQQFHQVAVKENNEMWVASALFQMGELYMKMDDYRSALAYYREAFKMDNPDIVRERVVNDWDIWVKMEYAEIFSHLHQFDSAWHYFQLYKPSRTDDRYFRIYLVSTGEYFLIRQQYNLALNNFLAGLSMHRLVNDRNEIQRTLVFAAQTYLACSNYAAALSYAREGLVLAQQTKARQNIRDCYRVIYMVYDWRKQTDSANIFFRRYTAINDSVANDQIKAKMAALNYEEKIALLDREKLIQQQEIHQSVLQKRLLVAVMSAILLLSVFLFTNIVAKRKNEANKRALAERALELQQSEAEKTRTSLHQKAADLEMQALRAQMNPHFIFNSLNSINRFILEKDKVQASAYLTKFSRLVRLILQNSQSSLITIENELESLKLYLELEAVRFDQHFSYNIRVAKDLDISAVKVPPLIIQPYVENAIWHGLMHKEEKGQLEIELYQQDELLCCRIKDNGIGRKKAQALKSKSAASHKSMGMQITASRIKVMGLQQQKEVHISIADLENPDGVSCGTEVLLKIPLNYD